MDGDNRPYCEVTLLSQEGLETMPDNKTVWSWRDLLVRYGQYRKGVSQFRLKTTDDMDDHASDIIGIFDFHPTEPNKILWTPDSETLPINTLQTISGMVDFSPMFPLLEKGPDGKMQLVNYTEEDKKWHYPGDGRMPVATAGQRYLLASDLYPVPEWTNLRADMNDIIEFDGTAWKISFDASVTTDVKVVLNGKSGKQLRWTGEVWVDAISADYNPGYWRVFL